MQANNTNSRNHRNKHTRTLVGIVVPIYNVEKYLRECLDSILVQSYRDFFVVLVNDGSEDTCLSIACEYVAKDCRFVLFDKANGGLSSARNVGIHYFANHYKIESMESRASKSTRDISLKATKYSTMATKGIVDTLAFSKEQYGKMHSYNLASSSLTMTNDNKDCKNIESKGFGVDCNIVDVNKPDSSDLLSGIKCGRVSYEGRQMSIFANENLADFTPPKIDYIIFLDSDDYWESNCLQSCINAAFDISHIDSVKSTSLDDTTKTSHSLQGKEPQTSHTKQNCMSAKQAYCHTERSEVSRIRESRDIFAQYDKNGQCNKTAPLHTESTNHANVADGKSMLYNREQGKHRGVIDESGKFTDLSPQGNVDSQLHTSAADLVWFHWRPFFDDIKPTNYFPSWMQQYRYLPHDHERERERERERNLAA